MSNELPPSSSNSDPTPAGSGGETPTNADASGSNRDRDLIEAAINAQTPFEATPAFEGDLPAADTFPGYDLIREIHRGGQGVVYLALQRSAKRRVAIKVMHSGPFLGSKGRARFEREVQILGQLNHPNIVRIHDSGVTKDGSFFYVMDYISGRTLNEHIAAKTPDLETLLRLFAKICQGINAAHLKGVIHRDIKPANIRVDQNGEPVIVDFGLAKITLPNTAEGDEQAREAMSMTGQFIGSLPWASPEQAEGAPGNIDVRTDVYSLGVVLYQMLTGRFPYEVIGNMRDVLDRILRAEPIKPSTVRRNIGDEVETIVLKCLRKEPDRRYQNAGDLGRDIDRYLSGQPIDAKSDSGWYVISKTLSRYRIPVGISVAFLLMIVGFAVVMAILYRQKADAQLQATQRQEIAEENASIALDLANSMLYELPPSIDKLIGATRGKRTLLATLETQITKLQARNPSDPQLLAMLADCHETMGDLRSGLSMQSTGTLDQAEASFEAARAIRESLALAHPSADATARLARIYTRMALVRMGRLDFAGAEALTGKAVSFADQAISGAAGETLLKYSLLKLEAQVREADARLRKITEIGNPDPNEARQAAESGVAQYQALSDRFTALLNDNPGNESAARWIGVMNDKRSAALLTLASRLRVRGERGNEQQAGAGDAFLSQADELCRRALDLAVAAVTDIEALRERYPNNGEIQRDLWLAWYMAGSASAEKGRIAVARKDNTAIIEAWSASLRDMTRGLELARQLFQSDPANLEAKRDLTGALLRRGNAHRELARAGERPDDHFARALTDFEECLSLREQILATDEMQQHRRDLAAAQFKVAQIALLSGDAQTALDMGRRSQKELQTLVQEGAMKSDNTELRDVSDLLKEAALQ